MRTRLDIQTKLTPMLYAVGTSTYFTPTRVLSAIDDAYIKVGSAKQWGDTKKGFVTSSVANQEYYDYPDNCQTESIFKIAVDGDSKYTKKDFEDYLRFKEDYPNSTDKMFSEYGRQLFIFPTTLTNGLSNLIFWGVIQAAKLTGDGSVTMFTDWADDLNDAILQIAYGDLIQNIDAAKSATAIANAEKIINREYKKIADRLQRKLMDRPQFEVPDYFSNSSSSIGNFSIGE